MKDPTAQVMHANGGGLQIINGFSCEQVSNYTGDSHKSILLKMAVSNQPV